MSTPGELIRDKAQKVLMLQTLFNASKEQQDYDSMSSTLEELKSAADDVQDFSMDNNSFEGLVVYTNATSFVYRVYFDLRMYSMALPYSLLIANSALLLISSLETKVPVIVDPVRMAHFKMSYLAQVIVSFLSTMDVDANAEVLRKPEILDQLFKVMGCFVAVFDNLKRVASQSPMIQKMESVYNTSRKYADQDSINDDTGYIIDVCGALFDLVIELDLED